MRLLHPSETPPPNLAEILLELGPGDARFGGTPFGKGECSLEDCLRQIHQREDPATCPAEFVPQSVYWLIDDNGQMVGIVRVRHPLNERMTLFGGNIAYYVRPAERGKGYGSQALRLALEPLRQRGASRALITVHPDNEPSARVALANGGVRDGQSADPISGEVVDRYWIEL